MNFTAINMDVYVSLWYDLPGRYLEGENLTQIYTPTTNIERFLFPCTLTSICIWFLSGDHQMYHSSCSIILWLYIWCSFCFEHPPHSPNYTSTLIKQESSYSCFKTHHRPYSMVKHSPNTYGYFIVSPGGLKLPPPGLPVVVVFHLWTPKAYKFFWKKKMICSSSCPLTSA